MCGTMHCGFPFSACRRAAGVTMQVELKVPVGEGERALKLLQQRKQKIFKAKDRFESNAAIDDLNLEQHVEEHFHQILDTAALESAQTVHFLHALPFSCFSPIFALRVAHSHHPPP